MEDFTITHIGNTELSLPMPFKFIPAKGKTFMFQADDGSNLGSKSKGIPITFENDFWICAYLTIQEVWEVIVKISDLKDLSSNPSRFRGKTRPVEQVSWEDIQVFNNSLNNLLNNSRLTITDKKELNGKFVLPSEAQWEYSAEAGQALVFVGSQNLNDVAWYNENSTGQTMPVGQKQPNVNKLYDMSGNVWEWCRDSSILDLDEIGKKSQSNETKKQFKVLRGGGYINDSDHCRLRHRGFNPPYYKGNIIGFRLAFSPFSTTY